MLAESVGAERMRILAVPSILCGLAMFAGGCAPASPDVATVTGVVFFAEGSAGSKPTTSTDIVGKPVAGAKVTFHDEGAPIGYGITDDLGRFRIRQYPRPAEPIDGLPLGLYSITITKLNLVPKSASGGVRGAGDDPLAVPERYSHPQTTDWQVIEVVGGNNKNHFRLAVKQ